MAVKAMIQEIVDFCKGRIPVQEGRYFYNYFRIRQMQGKSWGVPRRLWQVRTTLYHAWWIEEEDIRQQIAMFLFMFRPWLALNSYTRKPYRKWFTRLKWKILKLMARWLEGQKVFSRSRFAPLKYQDWILDNASEEEDTVLSILNPPEDSKQNQQNLFDRYLYYLWYTSGIDREEIAQILVTNTRQVDRFKSKFYPDGMICEGTRRFYAAKDSE